MRSVLRVNALLPSGKIFRIGCGVLLLFFLGCQGQPATGKKARAFENLGNALMQDGKIREALENYLEAYKLNPDNPDLNHEIALAYRELNQYDLSLTYFNKALALRPQFPEAQNNLGTVYLLMRKWDPAIEQFQKAANNVLYRTPHFAYNNMGMAYVSKGDFKNAIIYYKKALELFPGFSACFKNLGLAYEADGNQKEAIDAYGNAIKITTPEEPEHIESHFFLGRLYLKLGRKKEAKEMLARALELDPQAPFAGEAKKLLASIKP